MIMETLIISFKRKKDYQLIKELVSHFDAEIEDLGAVEVQKSKIKSIGELRKMGGIVKNQLISKEHIRNLSWKKRN